MRVCTSLAVVRYAIHIKNSGDGKRNVLLRFHYSQAATSRLEKSNEIDHFHFLDMICGFHEFRTRRLYTPGLTDHIFTQPSPLRNPERKFYQKRIPCPYR